MKKSTNFATLVRQFDIERSVAKIISIRSTIQNGSTPAKNNSKPTKLCIRQSDENIIITISNILRLESASNYTVIHLLDNTKIVASKTMKTLMTLLEDDQFIRCHRSHVVNINKISSFSKNGLTLCSGKEIPIARMKYNEIVTAMQSICGTV